jgi:hypothetical protein
MTLTPTQQKVVADLEDLVYRRWTIQDLNQHLSETFKEKIEVVDVSSSHNKIPDYNLMFDLEKEEQYGHFDIYYLKLRQPNICGVEVYITEISYKFE